MPGGKDNYDKERGFALNLSIRAPKSEVREYGFNKVFIYACTPLYLDSAAVRFSIITHYNFFVMRYTVKEQ